MWFDFIFYLSLNFWHLNLSIFMSYMFVSYNCIFIFI